MPSTTNTNQPTPVLPGTYRTYPQDIVEQAYRDRVEQGTSFATLATRYGFSSPQNGRAAILHYARSIGRPLPARLANRRFGVEIECMLSFTEAEEALRDAGVPSRGWVGYTHEVGTTWKVVSDSSVRNGCEVVSPPLKGKAGITQVKKVMKALRARGASVNVNCGLHVHLEADDLDGESLDRLCKNYATLQQSINTLLPASRRNGTYSRDFTNEDARYVGDLLRTQKDQVRNGMAYIRIDRYKSVNVQSFPLYGTIEFRQHQGTVNGTKTGAWITLLNAMLAAAVNGHVAQPGDDVLDIVRDYGTPAAADFLARRREALA